MDGWKFIIRTRIIDFISRLITYLIGGYLIYKFLK